MLNNLETKFNSNTFSAYTENCVLTGHSYMESIILFCEKNNIEYESVASLVKKSDVIRSKLEAECRRNNLLEKGSELTIFK